MKIFNRETVKKAVKVASAGMGACASVAVKAVLKDQMPEYGKKWQKVVFAIGVGGIGAAVSMKVAKTYEDEYGELVDAVFDAIEEAKAAKEPEIVEDEHGVQVNMVDMLMNRDHHDIEFATVEEAESALSAFKAQVHNHGYISMWCVFTMIGSKACWTEAFMTHGWTDLEDAYISETFPGRPAVVLPRCVKHERMDEVVEITNPDGSKVYKTNNFRIIQATDAEGNDNGR